MVLTWKQTVAAETGIMIAGGLATLAPSLILDTISLFSNSYFPKTTAVFTSSYDKRAPRRLTNFGHAVFMYGTVASYFHKQHSGIDFYLDATKEELLSALEIPRYENVVFMGHGDATRYRAQDESVTVDDILSRDISKKSGTLIQYTCGSEHDGVTMADALLHDPSKAINWKRGTYPTELTLASWRLLFGLGHRVNFYERYFAPVNTDAQLRK